MAKPAKAAKFKTKLTTQPEQSGWHYLVVEKKVAEQFPRRDKTRRVLCSINGAEAFPCALMPWGDIFYIMVNKTRRTELGIVAGDTVNVVLESDDSEYGMPMPAEFREVLDQDAEGERLFHGLTPGMQRSMLYYFGTIDDIDRRIHAGLVLIDHLKRNGGKIVHKVLSEELKRPFTAI